VFAVVGLRSPYLREPALAEQIRTCGAAFSVEAGRTTGNSEPALPGLRSVEGS
jgi:hypothetical protein